MEYRWFVLLPALMSVVGLVYYGSIPNLSELGVYFLRLPLELLIRAAQWDLSWPSWTVSLPDLPDMQMLWSCWSFVAWLFFPRPIPPSASTPEGSLVADEPAMPVFAPLADGKFKDRAEELMVPLNWEDATFKKEVAEKGESIIDSLPLKSYRERGDCDVQAGILINDFPKTVELLAKDLKLPEEMKDRIINAARVRDGDTRALEQIDFSTDDGRFYFGKIAIVKRENGFLDMAYSLLTIKYEVNGKAKRAQMAEKLLKAAASKATEETDLESSDFFKFSDVNSLKEYFQVRAVEEFTKKCKGPRRGLPTL